MIPIEGLVILIVSFPSLILIFFFLVIFRNLKKLLIFQDSCILHLFQLVQVLSTSAPLGTYEHFKKLMEYGPARTPEDKAKIFQESVLASHQDSCKKLDRLIEAEQDLMKKKWLQKCRGQIDGMATMLMTIGPDSDPEYVNNVLHDANKTFNKFLRDGME